MRVPSRTIHCKAGFDDPSGSFPAQTILQDACDRQNAATTLLSARAAEHLSPFLLLLKSKVLGKLESHSQFSTRLPPIQGAARTLTASGPTRTGRDGTVTATAAAPQRSPPQPQGVREWQAGLSSTAPNGQRRCESGTERSK